MCTMRSAAAALLTVCLIVHAAALDATSRGLPSQSAPPADTITPQRPSDGMPSYSRGVRGSVLSNIKQQLDAVEISVTADAGASCDNRADDAGKIQNAVNMALALSGSRGAVVKFPHGICAATYGPTVPRQKVILFRGEGIGASVLRITEPNADGITFANDEYLITGGGVQDLSIEAGAGFQASGSFAAQSSGTGVKAVHMNNGWGLHNVEISGFQRGLALLGSWNTTSTNVHVRLFSEEGVYVDTATDKAISGGNKIIGGTISNAGFAKASASVALRVRASGGDFFAKLDLTGSGTGVLVDPYAGVQVAYLWFDSVLSDTSIGDAWVIDGTNAPVVAIRGTDTWGSYSGGNGLLLKGNMLRGFRMKGMGLRENGERGLWIQGGSGIELNTVEIHSNSRGRNGIYPGVEIADGVTEPKSFALVGGSIGNWESSTADQGSSIKFAGRAANFRIEAMDLTGPGGGRPVVEIDDETKLTAFKMLGNLPAAVYGVNPSERIAQPIGGHVEAGGTAYFGPANSSPQADAQPFFTARAILAGKVFVAVSTAPGRGQALTFQLMQNGRRAGATGVISGAASNAATFYPGILLNPGDSYSLKASGSPGAAAAVVHGFLQLEP